MTVPIAFHGSLGMGLWGSDCGYCRAGKALGHYLDLENSRFSLLQVVKPAYSIRPITFCKSVLPATLVFFVSLCCTEAADLLPGGLV